MNLWADEGRRIHQCLTEALQQLIARRVVSPSDDEKTITGKLRPILKSVRKQKKLKWSLQSEASTFQKDTDADPIGHPDIRLTRLDKEKNQYDYDIECKLVRVKRPGKTMDYCAQYVKEGMLRYQSGKYAQSSPPMGAMLGYVQEGDFSSLLDTVNEKAKYQGLSVIQLKGVVMTGGVTKLSQQLKRRNDQFILYHLWADVR
ncbi:MAG: hypothetical protein ABIL11_13765 [Chloroflexota bacterium]